MNETNTLIDTLQVIRGNLRSAVRDASNLTDKLIGPKPANAEQKPSASDLRGVVGEILALSEILGKQIAEQHQLVGTFAPEPAAPNRAYA